MVSCFISGRVAQEGRAGLAQALLRSSTLHPAAPNGEADGGGISGNRSQFVLGCRAEGRGDTRSAG